MPAPVPPPPPPGGIYPVGQVLMTDYTRRQLETLGWKEGDPVPDSRLAQRIAQVQAAIKTELEQMPNVDPNREPVRPSRTIELSQLPPEKQAELRQALQEYTAEAKREAAAAAAQAATDVYVNPQAPPSVQAAQRVAAQTAMASSADIVFEPSQPKVTALPPIPAPAAAPAAPAAETAPTAGAVTAPTHCPRCDWDLQAKFDLVPSDTDRTAFVVALMSMTRFEKTYPLFGGKMTVTYRSLLARETNLLFKTLGQEVRDGQINGDGEYMMQLMDYRLAMSVASLRGEDTILQDVPAIFDIPCDNESQRLPKMLEWFNEEVVINEPLRRIVGKQHREFQRLVEALEAQTSAPDFWKGIDLPH